MACISGDLSSLCFFLVRFVFLAHSVVSIREFTEMLALDV